MDESGKLLVEELPQPPEGYRWKVLPDINAGMVVPESWFFLKEESEGTFGYFFSKEDISVEGSYKVGLAINVIKKCSEVTGKSAARFARDYITKMIMNSDTLQTWSAKISTIEQYGCRSLIVGQDDSHIVSHTQAMGNLETDTFYLMIFESPKDDWPEVSEIGRTMLQLFILDDEV